jgi:hypothetical protein
VWQVEAEEVFSPQRKAFNELSAPDEQKTIVQEDAIDVMYYRR